MLVMMISKVAKNIKYGGDDSTKLKIVVIVMMMVMVTEVIIETMQW